MNERHKEQHNGVHCSKPKLATSGISSTTSYLVVPILCMHATQMSVPRRVQGVSRMDRVRNEDSRQRLGQEGNLDLIRRRQENWKCRADEMNSSRNTKKVNVGVIEGRRPRGRQRMR